MCQQIAKSSHVDKLKAEKFTTSDKILGGIHKLRWQARGRERGHPNVNCTT